jgi:hypothetical protein
MQAVFVCGEKAERKKESVMKRVLRLLAGILAPCLLAGCGGTGGAELSSGPSGSAAPAPEASVTARVAYVPLDDRPVNTDRVVYLAESLGFSVSMPDPALYHTCLDGQEKNADGTQYGDRAALLEWVEAQEAAGCDNYILSLDQLLSGGLVNSRAMSDSVPVTLSDGTVLTEDALLERLMTLLGSDRNNHVYLLDTVMRLAPTVGYGGFDLTGYNTLRSYGMVERPALAGEQLTLENITAGYALASDGTEARAKVDPAPSQAVIGRYLAARARKLRLTDEALRLGRDLPGVSFLIGVDDSAPSASIQTSEIAYLRAAVGDRGAVLSGADEDGMLAVCRLYADWFCTVSLSAVQVRYFGGGQDRATSEYDHQPLTDIVSAHLDYLGLRTAASGESGALQVLVLTAPAESGQADAYLDALLTALEENQRSGTPTILMDAAKGSYDTARWQSQLLKRAELGFLLGYAGFYDLANVTGIALSCGVARYLCLTQEGTPGADRNRAHMRALADSLLKDLCYKNRTKPALAAWIKNDLGGDPDNLAASGTDVSAVTARLASQLETDSADVLDNLAGSNLIVSLSPLREQGWGGAAVAAVSLPWQRVFEVRLQIDVNDLTKIHKKFLDFRIS